ncbi:zinc finger MYND domain-containing protein 12 [Paramormyrops kingsleyae]|uniref:Zinc finger, MYND-type containing 12 n=1 Tax=Paramormyrops kingsleyae TaxID=1676925 RepID=A0A3B3SPL3_9TELE|nr:zinc finger MYND domain-containing protein 12 [Paramormyrops kingsleyae]
MSSTINPLANPKGTKKVCELCEKPAHIQCTGCRVTFYCNTEHQQADWAGIHQKVCQLLAPLRTPIPFHVLGAEREHHRAQRLQRQEQLIEISRATAQRKLFEKNHWEALPAAQLCLCSATDVYGPGAVQLVPAYLLLAEANIGLGRFSQAEEYLAQAEWIVMKGPECSLVVRHQLHRNLGRLHAATENFEEALFHLANDVYYASEEFGLDSTVTCGGYILMANIFFKQKKYDIAMSLCTEVANTWHSHLYRILDSHIQNYSSLHNAIDEAQQAEADRTLQCVLELEEQIPKRVPCLMALACHALAMLWLLGNDFAKAAELGRRALALSQLEPDCGLTEPIQRLLKMSEARGGLEATGMS